MRRLRAELALAGVTVIWGTTFVVVKGALEDVSPLLFVALRFALAALVLGICFRKHVFGAAGRLALGPAALCGGLLFAAYVFQTVGLELTTPANSAFLTSLSVPLVPLAASLVYRNRPRPVEVAGIAVATAGMVLMTAPPGKFVVGRGDWLSILCAVTFAVHVVAVGHFSARVGFRSLAVLQTLATAGLSVAACLVAGPVKFHPGQPLAIAVLLTGLLATALAFTVQAWAQQYTSATRAAVIFALEPVVALATAWLLTGETLSFRGKVGAGLILGGILLVELKRSKPERHPLIEAERLGTKSRSSRRVEEE